MQSLNKSAGKSAKLAIATSKLYKKGKIKEARRSASKLASSITDPSHLYQVGIAAHQANDFKQSITLLDLALLNSNKNPSIAANLHAAKAMSLTADGQVEQAVLAYDQSLELSPKDPQILNNRALTVARLGRMDDAIQDLKKAFSIAPNNANILLNLAKFLSDQGQTDSAVKLLQDNSLQFQNNADFHASLGDLKKESAPYEALVAYKTAAYLEPKNSSILDKYAGIFENLASLVSFDNLEQDLLLLLSNDQVEWRKLNVIILRHLKNSPEFQLLQPSLLMAIKERKSAVVEYGTVVKILTNNVFLASLRRIRLQDPEIEKLLETFRQQTLTAIANGIKLDAALERVLVALLIPLAEYCFSSEYVFSTTPAEVQSVEQVIESLQSSAGNTTADILKFLIGCCYQLPYQSEPLKAAAKRLKTDEFPALQSFIRTAIEEPEQERKSYAGIPALTEINDAISLSVREQYEENPYPRWLHLPHRGTTSYEAHIKRNIPALSQSPLKLPTSPDVLIAGCGTGKQPISTARSFPETNVTAIDLSRASIAYAMRKSRELNVKNITYGQADIMELEALNKRFDIIECAGVLHHMDNPSAGWQVLMNILKDDGFMLIGLYSELGRKDVVAARNFIADNQYGNDIQSIRNCRKHLFSLDQGNPAKDIIRQSDFYTTSACRDLIFHVQEHRFTIQRIQSSLEALGLEFLGFIAHRKRIDDQYLKMFPDDPTRTNLDNWAIFEEKNPDTFATMYKFWVRKRK